MVNKYPPKKRAIKIQEARLIPIRINLNKIYALKQQGASTDMHRYGDGLKAAGGPDGASPRNGVQPGSRHATHAGTQGGGSWGPNGR